LWQWIPAYAGMTLDTQTFYKTKLGYNYLLGDIIMLKKELRIRKQKDFENVFDKGFYSADRFLTLKVIENKMSYSRFGFVVSKKVSKKAVDRNRVKRLMSEIIRLMDKKIKSGFDAVFILKSEIVNKNLEEIKESVEKLLKRSGLLEK
jgi:ribonuclease P protein component